MPAPLEPAPPENSKNPQIPESSGSSPGGQADAVSSPQVRTQPSDSPGRSMILLLVAAVISTALASVLVQQLGSPFQIPRSVTADIGQAPTPEQAARVAAAKRTRDSRNAFVTFALIGSALGMSFGIAVGLARHSRRALIQGLAGGILCGAAAGTIAGAIEAISVPALVPSLNAENRAILAGAFGWATTGIGVGLGVNLATHCRRSLVSGTLAALGGGLIGGIVYVPIVAMLVPDVDTEMLVPDSFVGKLVWIALPAIGMALGMGRALVRTGLAAADVDGRPT